MNIIIDDAVFNGEEIFSEFGNVKSFPGRQISNMQVKNADILVVRSRTQVNQELLKNSNIKFVGSAVSGVDHIDMDYLNNNNIIFADAKGCNANAVAEFVIYNILNLAEKYKFNYQDKVLGIVGVGKVGSSLAKKAKNLGIKLLLNDIKTGNFVKLDFLLKNSDIVSFHTPLDKTTYRLLDANNFSFLKKDAIIINSARGGVINETEWLKHKGIKIIDCWENEPYINQNLLNLAELATPHIAGHSIDAKFMGSYMVYQKLCKFLKIKPKNHMINFTDKRILQKKNNFNNFIKQVYNFKNDDKAIRNSLFEDYRRNYPARFEWHNYEN